MTRLTLRTTLHRRTEPDRDRGLLRDILREGVWGQVAAEGAVLPVAQGVIRLDHRVDLPRALVDHRGPAVPQVALHRKLAAVAVWTEDVYNCRYCDRGGVALPSQDLQEDEYLMNTRSVLDPVPWMERKRHSPHPALLEEVVRRIVEVAQPERIILFGSAARGEMSRDSDIDLLVIKSGVKHTRRMAMEIDHALGGLRESFDVIVATPEEIERYGNSPALVYHEALREGWTLYAAGKVSAG
jgi:uncharacterized protein